MRQHTNTEEIKQVLAWFETLSGPYSVLFFRSQEKYLKEVTPLCQV